MSEQFPEEIDTKIFDLIAETAKRMLNEGKAIELGPLVKALLDSAGLKLAFTSCDFRGLYEMTLLRLEQEVGPLACQPSCNDQLESDEEESECDEGDEWQWGYAAKLYKGVPCPMVLSNFDFPSPIDLVHQRIASLSAGHPDGKLPLDEYVPSSVWMRAA